MLPDAVSCWRGGSGEEEAEEGGGGLNGTGVLKRTNNSGGEDVR